MTAISVAELCRGSDPGPLIDTLCIPELGDGWNDKRLNALLHLCAKFKIRRLILIKITTLEGDWLEAFEKYSYPNDDRPFLSNLCSITLGIPLAKPLFIHLMDHSRVKRVVFRKADDTVLTLSQFMSDVFSEINNAFRNLFYYKSVRDMYFSGQRNNVTQVRIYPLRTPHDDWDGKATVTCSRCAQWIEQNRVDWERCRKVSLIVLGLRKLRKSELSVLVKDLVGIIERMIWETKVTTVWDEKKGV